MLTGPDEERAERAPDTPLPPSGSAPEPAVPPPAARAADGGPAQPGGEAGPAVPPPEATPLLDPELLRPILSTRLNLAEPRRPWSPVFLFWGLVVGALLLPPFGGLLVGLVAAYNYRRLGQPTRTLAAGLAAVGLAGALEFFWFWPTSDAADFLLGLPLFWIRMLRLLTDALFVALALVFFVTQRERYYTHVLSGGEPGRWLVLVVPALLLAAGLRDRSPTSYFRLVFDGQAELAAGKPASALDRFNRARPLRRYDGAWAEFGLGEVYWSLARPPAARESAPPERLGNLARAETAFANVLGLRPTEALRRRALARREEVRAELKRLGGPAQPPSPTPEASPEPSGASGAPEEAAGP